MKKISGIIIVLIYFTITPFACQHKDKKAGYETVVPEEKVLVSISSVAEVKLKDLQTYASAYRMDDFKSQLLYDVQVEMITYKTIYKGKPVVASGLMFTPKSTGISHPILSAHHGTTFRKKDAPSVSYGISEEEFAASAGFITPAPDYLGYGASSDIFHPYYDAFHSAKAVTDMIKAGKEALKDKKVAHNSNLFLFGYSEGGYVTLAAQKAIEEEKISGLQLKGVAAGAGGYDLTGMLTTLTESKEYTYPAYLAFIIQSFNLTYDWNKPLNYFFKNIYAERLKVALDGTYGGSYINSQLTTLTDSLLNENFYYNVKNSGEPAFKQALAKNSLTSWIPQTPLKLYHGTNDEVIPYQNSESTYQKFKNHGASVELMLIDQGTHGSSLLPMLRSAYPWFIELNK